MNKITIALVAGLFASMFVLGTLWISKAGGVQKMDKIIQAIKPAPDPFSASEMVKKFPELQKICDLAGGCGNVKIECEQYDGTGNSSLRNETVWTIKALGVEGTGFSSYGGFAAAIGQRYPGWWGARLRDEEKESTVYPKSKPCSLDCLK